MIVEIANGQVASTAEAHLPVSKDQREVVSDVAGHLSVNVTTCPWLLEHEDYLEIEFDSNPRIDAGRALFVVEGFYERP